MQIFKKLLFLFTDHERKRAILLLLLIIIMALLDMIGVASILPFMTVLTNPDLIETNQYLNLLFQSFDVFGVEDNQQFIFVLGIMVFLLLVISILFKAFTTYVQVKFIQMREYSIGKRLVEAYLNQPYSWFLSQNSADLGKTILSEVAQVTTGGIRPLIELIGKTIVTIALIVLLIITDPKLSLIVGFSLSAAYIIVYYLTRNYLSKIGSERLKNNKLRFITISEAFGASKEVKVGGLENTYAKSFSKAAHVFAQNQASAIIIGQLPRFALEAIAFGGIILLILYMMTLSGGFNSALPILSLYVFAGYRLIPALQQIYVSFTQLTFIKPSIDKLYADIKSLKPPSLNHNKDTISLNTEIKLDSVSYNYPNSSRTALNDVSLTIPAKAVIGLVGATGSGKTTTVDIILGLLESQKGSLKVDGKVINLQNVRSWQRSIGYVPQHIYLSDDTIESNIAFGKGVNEINHDSVAKASKVARLHEFVVKELPNQYQTVIGERGVRLSGGQRQRIGIARALYNNPQVLILDEATSALDNQTEKAVMDAVNNLSKKITIILIAHRLNTVKNCDIIFKLKKGKIVEKGTFDEIIKTN